MKRSVRPWMSALVVVLTLLAAACGGGEVTEPVVPEGGETQAGTVDTTCQVELPAAGEGSAEGMTDDPFATAASNNPALSSFAQAAQQAELVDPMNNLEAGTVFIPTNDAFAEIPQDEFNALLADRQRLARILTLHIVRGRLDAAALASMDSVQTVNGQDIALAVENGTLTVNGQARVICPNVRTANATVHLIDTVMMPAS
jgi:uncharacterized surface protein with fasciclin (FAS1) repeats